MICFAIFVDNLCFPKSKIAPIAMVSFAMTAAKTVMVRNTATNMGRFIDAR